MLAESLGQRLPQLVDIARLIATNRDFMWNKQIKNAKFQRIDGGTRHISERYGRYRGRIANPG